MTFSNGNFSPKWIQFCKFLFQSGIPSKAIQIGVIYEDFKRLTMSSPSFPRSIKRAIITQEKSGLMEKWPLDTKEEHKRRDYRESRGI